MARATAPLRNRKNSTVRRERPPAAPRREATGRGSLASYFRIKGAFSITVLSRGTRSAPSQQRQGVKPKIQAPRRNHNRPPDPKLPPAAEAVDRHHDLRRRHSVPARV